MKQVVPEVLLCLQVHHPSRALVLDTVDCPLQPCGREGDLLIITLGDTIDILHKNIKGGHSAKDKKKILQDVVNTHDGSHIPGHICCCPL